MKSNNTNFKTFFKKQTTEALVCESHHVDITFFNELCHHLEQKFKIDVTHPDSIGAHNVNIEDLREEANNFTDEQHHINSATEEELVKILDCETSHEFMIRLLSNTI